MPARRRCVIGKLCGSGGDVVAERAEAVFQRAKYFPDDARNKSKITDVRRSVFDSKMTTLATPSFEPNSTDAEHSILVQECVVCRIGHAEKLAGIIA
jgi:hypothetical protein